MRNRTFRGRGRHFWVLFGAVALVAAKCDGPKPCAVQSVSVSPSQLTLIVGQTATLTAVINSTDCSPEPSVTWSSGSEVSIVANGMSAQVTGVSVTANPVAVTASAEGKSGSSQVTVTSLPSIMLSVTTLSFTATQGGANPASQLITITNSSGGSLTGLSTGTISYGPGATGWLQAPTLSTTTAPATLTVQPVTGSLTPGAYSATIPVQSAVASNSPQPLTVTFTVNASSHVIQGTITLASTGVLPASAGRSVATSVLLPGGQRRQSPVAERSPAGLPPSGDGIGEVAGAAHARPRPPVPGEWVVTFRSEVLGLPRLGSMAYSAKATSDLAIAGIQSSLTTTLSAGHASLAGISPAILTARVKVIQGLSAATVRDELRANPAVLSVQPNYWVYSDEEGASLAATTIPNDTYYPIQAWHYEMIDLPRAWAITTGSASVLVAVVDNGIRFTHPDLQANLTSDGYDFVSNVPDSLCAGGTIGNSGDNDGYDADPTNPADYQVGPNGDCLTTTLKTAGNHGLHVAGTIGARGNDGSGVTGVNWNVRIRPVRVLGLLGGSNYDVAQGILYAAGLPADDGQGGTVTAPTRAAIINLSLGSPDSTDVVKNSVVAATAAGSLVIASAGNNANSAPNYPAAFGEVLSVSAVGPSGALASYSSFGPTVDIAAPGGDFSAGNSTFGVLSTFWNFQTNTATYGWDNGTSMAAPHVSGVAALILAANPGLTNTQLRSRLETYAVDLGAPGVDDQFGHGLVNARNALTQTTGPSRSLKAFLIDAGTGANTTSVTATGGNYQFSTVPSGSYLVYAGEDESADGLFGRPFNRWGAFGGSGTPTTVTVSGPGTTMANLTIGLPVESEPNNTAATANVLVVGGYQSGSFSDPTTDVDLYRVTISSAGQYTFETSGIRGDCGSALSEDTNIDLLNAAESQIANNDDIGTPSFNLCSRITMTLAPGTYYVRVSAYTAGNKLIAGAPFGTIAGRRYTVSARAGS